MILLQFLHRDPVGISYLFGCGGRAAGAVVDPVGTVEPYLLAAEAAGMRIHFVVDTHVHADHLSAGRQLAEAEYVLSADAEVSFPFKAVRDGADRAHADGRRPRPHGAGGQRREGAKDLFGSAGRLKSSRTMSRCCPAPIPARSAGARSAASRHRRLASRSASTRRSASTTRRLSSPR